MLDAYHEIIYDADILYYTASYTCIERLHKRNLFWPWTQIHDLYE